MENILDSLNLKQREAVTTTEGFLRIVAGAGSGKTKALTHRYAYLVKGAGIMPQNILCVTFTSKAAGEMRRRVQSLIGDGFDTSLITTYHGFCVRVLRMDIEKLFFPNSFLILDTTDQKKILESIYDELELKLDHLSFQKIMAQIEKRKEELTYIDSLVDPKAIFDNGGKDFDDVIFRMYLQRQKKLFGLDFNDLINFTFFLFERHKDIMRKWQEQLHYIQVDEFQDSSDREMRLLDMLSDTNKNLFVVGDPDQNIYEWRGARVEILVNFDENHAATQTVVMDQNYRSTPEILAVANSLISKNTIRIKKNLFTQNSGGSPVIHRHAKDEKAEASWIVAGIRKAVSQGKRKYSDFAILYRAGFLSRYPEQALLDENVPYRIWGGVRFYDRMEVRDALAYLRMVAYQDDLSLSRIINVPRRKIGKTRLTYLRSCAEAEGTSLYAALLRHRSEEQFMNTGAEEFIDLIKEFRNKSLQPSDLMQQLLEKSGYERYIRENGDMERLDNLAELYKAVTEYENSFGENVTLEDYLNYVVMRYDEEEREENRDCVQLMTIHAAKGLEFPCVFIIGMTEGIFPSYRSIEERRQMGLEEERRLCFVAITRAKERLFLTEPEGFGTTGSKKLPSRFLFDIDEGLYERSGVIPEEIIAELRKTKAASTGNEGKDVLSMGANVNHAIFGKGEVKSVNKEKGVYNILFYEINKIKPISMEYDFSAGINVQSIPAPEPEIKESRRSETDIPDEIKYEVEIVEIKEKEVVEEIEEVELVEGEEDEDDDEIVEEEIINIPQNELTSDTNEKNLWKRSDVPHTGWTCVDLIDLGKPTGVCEMCGYQIIRYVHVMRHPAYSGRIGAGCICAGRMEGDSEKAALRERDYKNLLNRRKTFLTRKWKKSIKGNFYLNYMQKNVVLLKSKYKTGYWRFSIDGKMSDREYPSLEEAKLAAFDILNKSGKK
jgi:DNA helicase-2/ATP-dependent DNA helicase PcrA